MASMVKTTDLLGYAMHYPPNGCVRFQGPSNRHRAMQDLVSVLAELLSITICMFIMLLF